MTLSHELGEQIKLTNEHWAVMDNFDRSYGVPSVPFQKACKLTQFMDKSGSCMDGSYCNKKLLSAAGQIVM